jgi:hypothetical protein
VERPTPTGVLVPLVAVLAATALSGCFEGEAQDAASVNGGREDVSLERRIPIPPRRTESPIAGLEIAAVGDTMLGNTPELPPDPATYLDPVKDLLVGDVVFGNLEGALSELGESLKCPPPPEDESAKEQEEREAEPVDCFAFHVPPDYAGYLAEAGFTAMNNANNHSLDYGETGLEETVTALGEAGIAQTGLPGEVTLLKAGGMRVALLGFAPYAYTASLTDVETARALIEGAAAEADVVVVAIHAGAEGSDAQHVTGEEEVYSGEDRGNPEEFAHMAVDAGADLVLGSGPHVLRGMEVYEGRLVAYSLGNFAGFHNFSTEGVLGESGVLQVRLGPDGSFLSGKLVPLRLVEAGQPVPDPTGEAAATVAQLSKEDFGPTAVGIGAEGQILAP